MGGPKATRALCSPRPASGVGRPMESSPLSQVEMSRHGPGAWPEAHPAHSSQIQPIGQNLHASIFPPVDRTRGRNRPMRPSPMEYTSGSAQVAPFTLHPPPPNGGEKREPPTGMNLQEVLCSARFCNWKKLFEQSTATPPHPSPALPSPPFLGGEGGANPTPGNCPNNLLSRNILRYISG